MSARVIAPSPTVVVVEAGGVPGVPGTITPELEELRDEAAASAGRAAESEVGAAREAQAATAAASEASSSANAAAGSATAAAGSASTATTRATAAASSATAAQSAQNQAEAARTAVDAVAARMAPPPILAHTATIPAGTPAGTLIIRTKTGDATYPRVAIVTIA